nr:MAG TPA: hypothetical protein [Caudoviricetes sp.]
MCEAFIPPHGLLYLIIFYYYKRHKYHFLFSREQCQTKSLKFFQFFRGPIYRNCLNLLYIEINKNHCTHKLFKDYSYSQEPTYL